MFSYDKNSYVIIMKFLALFVFALIIVSGVALAHAEDAADVQAGITEQAVRSIEKEFPAPQIAADNWAYGFKRFGELIAEIFTFDPRQKVLLNSRFLKERAAELKDMAEREKNADMAAEDYKKQLESLKSSIEGMGIGSEVSGIIRNSSETVEKSIIVLQLVYQKVPESAKPALGRAINKSIEKKAFADLRVDAIAKGNLSEDDIRKELEKNLPDRIREYSSRHEQIKHAVQDYYLSNLEKDLIKIEENIREARKNNQSDLAKELELLRKNLTDKIASAGFREVECIKAGCSGELCVPKADEGKITICEYRPEYECLKKTMCRYDSAAGKCGWEETADYKKCMEENTGSLVGMVQ